MRSAFIATGDFRNENLMQLLRGAQGWHGRGAWGYLRSRTRELTILHCHGGPPDGRVAKTLYDLLGASPDDDAERLKEAFHKAVRANHPDLHPNDPDATVRLSGIVRAYAILRDAHERTSYDQALDCVRESPVSEPKRTFNAMHRIFTEAGTVVALGVTLTAGYALLANVLPPFSGKVEEVRESATIPTVEELREPATIPTVEEVREPATIPPVRLAGKGEVERIPSNARVRRAGTQSRGHVHAAVLHTQRWRALWPPLRWRWPVFH